MNTPYVPPSAQRSAFNCPHCGAYAKQEWFSLTGTGVASATLGEHLATKKVLQYPRRLEIADFHACECSRCRRITFWRGESLVLPRQRSATPPNADLPEHIRKDYEEAAAIMEDSPRGAAALLRLAVQKLCVHLGAKGHSLNDHIKKWVAQGLDARIERALDTVRVVGNNAVHPGKITVEDDPATVEKLLFLVNYIAEKQISEPMRIDELFADAVPEDERAKIERRDRPPA